MADSLVNNRLGSDDYRRLYTGEFSDCSVICGGRTWKTHKLILCRVKYFERALLSSKNHERPAINDSEESRKDEIIITEFRPFEVDILLRYIYDAVISISDICRNNQNRPFIETCVRVGILGEYFGIQQLSLTEASQLQCNSQWYESNAPDLNRDEIRFEGDLELGIRAAWGPKESPITCRSALVYLCIHTANRPSAYGAIFPLFDELPKFASELSKSALSRDAGRPRNLLNLIKS